MADLKLVIGDPAAVSNLPPARSIPSVADEAAYYTGEGYTWNPSIEPANMSYWQSAEPSYAIGDADFDWFHGNVETDDLLMYQRLLERGGSGLLRARDRRDEWLRYFRDTFVGSDEFGYDMSGFGMDHMPGMGLIRYYLQTGDAAAWSTAQELGRVVQSMWDHWWTNGGSWNGTTGRYEGGGPFRDGTDLISQYWVRASARMIRLACALKYASNDAQEWTDLVQQQLSAVKAATDWDERGFFAAGSFNTDGNAGAGSYAAGYRICGPWMQTLMAEAMQALYEETGDALIKDRIVELGAFIARHWDHEPVAGEKYTSDAIGFGPTGRYFGSQSLSAFPVAYTSQCTNAMVLAFRHSGNKWFLEQAKEAYYRGSQANEEVPDIQVSHRATAGTIRKFVDTQTASGTGFFFMEYNKGEFDSAWRIFENGASDPDVEGLTVLGNRVRQMVEGDLFDFTSESNIPLGEGFFLDDVNFRSDLAYGSRMPYNPKLRELNFVGQGHNADRHFYRYREKTNDWIKNDFKSAQFPDGISGIGHPYHLTDVDWATGEVYHLVRSSEGELHRIRPEDSGTDEATGLAWDLDYTTYSGAGTIQESALCYFPGADGHRYFLQITDEGIWKWDIASGPASGNWSQIATRAQMLAWTNPYDIAPSNSGDNWAFYCPRENCVYFGGGQTSTSSGGHGRIYRLNQDGSVDADLPSVNDTVANGGAGASSVSGNAWQLATPVHAFIEPVTGRFCFIYGPDGTFFEFLPEDTTNNSTGQWRRRTDVETTLVGSGLPFTFDATDGGTYNQETLSCSNHLSGVVIFCRNKSSELNPLVWLYKHKVEP